jgi:hypothetical protein
MTLEEFYRSNARRLSDEADYGVHWRDGAIYWPTWRVSYVRDTGEIYATKQGGSETSVVRVLGVVPADETADGGGCWYQTLERLLEGWATLDHDWKLSWVVGKLRAAGKAI